MTWMFLPLRRYAEFAGRSGRQEIWWYFLFYIVLWTVAIGGVVAIGLAASGNLTDGHSALSFAGLTSILMSLSTFALALWFLWLGLLLPTLAVQVRRLHDLDMSGWWLMISWTPALIAIVIRIVALSSQSLTLLAVSDWISWLAWGLFVVLLAFYCRPGMVGENRYGLDPAGGGADLAATFG